MNLIQFMQSNLEPNRDSLTPKSKGESSTGRRTPKLLNAGRAVTAAYSPSM